MHICIMHNATLATAKHERDCNLYKNVAKNREEAEAREPRI